MRKAKQISLCAILLALALALSYMERFVPLQLIIPLPGMKLGLANIVTLLALCLFKNRYALLILICRCVLGSIFGGGITGLAFSLCGGMLAFGCMALGKKVTRFSIFGVSVLGAAAHNIGQIIIATLIVSNYSVMYYIPVLMVAGFITGTLIGIVAQEVFLRVGRLMRVK